MKTKNNYSQRKKEESDGNKRACSKSSGSHYLAQEIIEEVSEELDRKFYGIKNHNKVIKEDTNNG